MVNQVKLLVRSVKYIDQLESDINQLISVGWQPQGNIKLLNVDNQQVLMQQMTLVNQDNNI